VAERAFAVLAVTAAGALGGAVWTAGWRFALPLACAAPLAGLALAFDLGKRSRAAGAELSGALALGAVATAEASAGGRDLVPAFALWVVLAARTVPTILFVRARLRLEKGQAFGRMAAAIAHVAAVALVALLAARGLAPWAVVAAMALLLARAAVGLSPLRPRWKTWQLGVSEIAFGLVVVLSVALGGTPS
jgi:hypothetical protein